MLSLLRGSSTLVPFVWMCSAASEQTGAQGRRRLPESKAHPPGQTDSPEDREDAGVSTG